MNKYVYPMIVLFVTVFVFAASGSNTAVHAQEFNCANVTGLTVEDCEVLKTLYRATDGDHWKDNTGWLTTNTPCRWYGIMRCDNNRVTLIDLGFNNLAGTIPPEIGNLTALRELLISANQLRGTLPKEIGNLTALGGLTISTNQFTGSIPQEFVQLANLDVFNFHNTQLCEPQNVEFQNWISGLNSVQGTDVPCHDVSGKVTDGYGHPLIDVQVDLRDEQSNFTIASTHTDASGAYRLTGVQKNGIYSLWVYLQDSSIRSRIYWGDVGILVVVQTQPSILTTSEDDVVRDIDFGDSSLDSRTIPSDKLDDLAIMYYHTSQVTSFMRNELGETAYVPVQEIFAYETDRDTGYYPGFQVITVKDTDSDWHSRPGEQMNREWHENFHYVMDSAYGLPQVPEGEDSHLGFASEVSSGSWAEGWSAFWPCVLVDSLRNPQPSNYWVDNYPYSMENQWKAWQYDFILSQEGYAVAGMLWDLYDGVNQADSDNVDLSTATIWSVIGNPSHKLSSVRDVYEVLQHATLVNEDGSPVTAADIDEIFVLHGFFGDRDNDMILDADEEVGWAGRDQRRHMPTEPGAYIKIRFEDVNGNKVSNGKLYVDMLFGNSTYDYSYLLDLAILDGNLLYFAPPSLEPETTRFVVHTSTGESEPFTITNTDYWDKVANSTTGYALEHTFVVKPQVVYLPLIVQR